MTAWQGFTASDGVDRVERARIHWPPRSVPEVDPVYDYVLEADDDLDPESDVGPRVTPRLLASAPLLAAEPGACDVGGWLTRVGHGPGLLVLDGVMVHQTHVAERTAAELLGPGDLLQPAVSRAEEMVEHQHSWRALCPSRLALLDAEFSERARPWPQIGEALLRRAGRRIADNAALRAITSHPRLELRIDLLLWHLAARWGRVEPAGIRLTLPLTHRLLGQLIGAERPSISHALHRLARSGLVTGTACDLHLHGSFQEHLDSLSERGGNLRAREHPAVATPAAAAAAAAQLAPRW